MDKNVQSIRYLPKIHLKSTSSVIIHSALEKAFAHLEYIDFSKARISNFLFKLRGINVPSGKAFERNSSCHFYKLDAQSNQAMYLGVIGKFWTMNGDLQKFDPDDFITYESNIHAKAVWEFSLKALDANKTQIQLSTLLYAPTNKVYKKLKRYWFFVKPISYLVKLEILHAFKQQVLRNTH